MMFKNQISIGLICLFVSTNIQAQTFPNVIQGAIQDDYWRPLLMDNSHLHEIENFARYWDNALVRYLIANNINLDGYIDQQNNYSRAFSEVNSNQINELLSYIGESEAAHNYFNNPSLQEEFNNVYQFDQSQVGNNYSSTMNSDEAFRIWIASKLLILNSGISQGREWADVDQLWNIDPELGTIDLRYQMCIYFCCDNSWWNWFSSTAIQ